MAKKTFDEDEDLAALASKIIKDHKMDYLNGIKIRYLMVSPYISKTVAGKCIRPNDELKHYSECDYLIEMSSSIWDGLKDEVKEVLMLHELKHILITADKDGNVQYKIAPHDLNDFTSIVDKYGIDWINAIKLTAASVNDLTPEQQDNIKL